MSDSLSTSLKEPHDSSPETGGICGRTQLARLFRLVLILQSERFPNARELAERCEVSRRTIYRDLEVLEAAGIPIRYRRERQGYQLGPGYFLPPTALSESETFALLVMVRQANAGHGLGLLNDARDGAVKLVQGLPPAARERVRAAADAFRDTLRDDPVAPDRREIHERILTSMVRSRQLRIWYAEEAAQDVESTKLSLYRLILHDRHWYMVGRSTLHRRVEVIGIHQVRRAALTDDPYAIPPRFDLERFLGGAWGVRREPIRHDVRLRFTPRVAAEIDDIRWHRSQKRYGRADGGVELHLTVDGLEEITRWLLGFGDQVEVLHPPRLRERVRQVALNLARLHGGEPGDSGPIADRGGY
jgi:predicted DNA-binding transcriptional regulator YafY